MLESVLTVKMAFMDLSAKLVRVSTTRFVPMVSQGTVNALACQTLILHVLSVKQVTLEDSAIIAAQLLAWRMGNAIQD